MQVSEFLAKIEQGQRDFRNVSLPKAKLHSAQLPLLNLDGANLEGADFTNANLAGSSLCHAQLGQSKMSGVNLLGAQCVKTSFRGADLSNALLSGAEFQGCDFKQANLTHASCVGVDLSGANLRYANLSHVNLKAAKLKGTDLYGANLDGADLEGADMEDLIWPDGTGQLMIDEGVTEDQEPSIETVNASMQRFGESAGETSVQSQEPGNAEPQVRFGDFALDDHNTTPLRSSYAGLLSSFPTPPESAQQRSLKLASQIASRLDRQVEYRFKKAVKSAYGDRCALSKSSIVSLLETVVIFPDAENDRDHPSNGLLLRIDLARLFQVNLIAIHPKDYRVMLSPSLRGSEYASFEGVTLNLPKEVGYHPNIDCLQAHFNQCDWIHEELENPQPSVEQSMEAVSSETLVQPAKVKPSGFLDVSKAWLKRINEVLNTPITPKLSSEKPGIQDESSQSVGFVPIAADAEPEAELETDLSSEVSETIGAEVSGDAVMNTTVESEEQEVEVIGFSAIETEEETEETEEKSVTEETVEEALESQGSTETATPLKQSSSFLPFRSFPSIFRPSSVTLNLDRLQTDLDAISKELEPYLPSTEPVENVADLIENIEKELQDDLEQESEIVNESFVALFGSPVNEGEAQQTIEHSEESGDAEATVLMDSDRSEEVEEQEETILVVSNQVSGNDVLEESDSPFVAVPETIASLDSADLEQSDSPFVAVPETIASLDSVDLEQSDSPFVAVTETIAVAEETSQNLEESESTVESAETIAVAEETSQDLEESESTVESEETIESLGNVDLAQSDSSGVESEETIAVAEETSQDLEESESTVESAETIAVAEETSQDLEESESTVESPETIAGAEETSQGLEESESTLEGVETIESLDNVDLEESESSGVESEETIAVAEETNQDLEESESTVESAETIATVGETSQDLEEPISSLTNIEGSQESAVEISSSEEAIDLTSSTSDITETLSDSLSASNQAVSENQKDLFDNWQDTSPEEANTDQEASVTTEDLPQDVEAEEKVEEEPAPKPFRKGLAALLFRRFIP